MNEILSDVELYIRMAWRYRWMALGLAVTVCLIGWGVVAILPNVYQVTATVQIERSSMLQALLKGITAESQLANEMAGLMRQTMLVKSNLEFVAHESGLDKGVDTPEKLDVLIERLGTSINISPSPARPSVYMVSYEHSDPAVAQRVVKTLLDRFQDTILAVTRKDLENSKRFVDEQIEQYRRKMEAAEHEIQEFQEKHLDVLGDGRTYYARLEDTKNQYKRAMLELQEAEMEVSAMRAEVKGPAGGTPIHKDGQPVTQIDLKIAELEKTLAELRVKFTEQHPDVIFAKRALEEWRTRKNTEPREAAGADVTTERQGAWLVDPAYQARQGQLTRGEAKVAGLRSRVEEYKRRVAELQDSVSTVPRMEVELAKLNREYSFQRDNYQTLVMRREGALVAGRLEQASELKINTLEAPRIPLRPISPRRVYLNTLVLVLGLAKRI
ncbi:MAG: XrtA system polysaccharide chain length determinant [Gammaproteobacteria bacterium]